MAERKGNFYLLDRLSHVYRFIRHLFHLQEWFPITFLPLVIPQVGRPWDMVPRDIKTTFYGDTFGYRRPLVNHFRHTEAIEKDGLNVRFPRTVV